LARVGLAVLVVELVALGSTKPSVGLEKTTSCVE
jgi:hypothetical protein